MKRSATKNSSCSVSKPSEFGCVAVLMGGLSAEREISLKSGDAVYEALKKKGVNAVRIDVDENVLNTLEGNKFDRAFIILHGRGGEDGVMQAVLEMLDLPYTGSGVLGSALSMDKLRTKQLWNGAGLQTPEYVELNASSDFQSVSIQLGFPIIVKPSREGSSIGMTKVNNLSELKPAWEKAAEYDDGVIAEKWVQGEEYTVAILQKQALPMIRLQTPNAFYDYEAKYESDTTTYHCPCGLSAEQEKELQAMALRAFHVLGARGWGRIDFMLDESGEPWLIEANTIPGMTDHSLVPMAAKAAGIGFEELVWKIMETSCG